MTERIQLRQLCKINSTTLPESTPADFSFHYIDLSCVKTGSINVPAMPVRFGDASPRARRRLQAGDVLVSTVRPNLQGFAVVEPRHADAIASTGFAVLRPHEGVPSGYLFQVLLSREVSKQLADAVAGSGYPAVTAAQVGSLKVPKLPPLDQSSIATILGSWDDQIESLATLLKFKRRLKRGLMQQLLSGDRRFPEFKRKPWREVCIGDVLQEVNRTHRLDPATAYRLVSIRRRSGGFFDREVRLGNQIGYPSLEQIHAGDFVIARRQVLHGAMATRR